MIIRFFKNIARSIFTSTKENSRVIMFKSNYSISNLLHSGVIEVENFDERVALRLAGHYT